MVAAIFSCLHSYINHSIHATLKSLYNNYCFKSAQFTVGAANILFFCCCLRSPEFHSLECYNIYFSKIARQQQKSIALEDESETLISILHCLWETEVNQKIG